MADRTFAATLDAVADAMRAKAELPVDRAFMLAVLGGAYIALAAFGSTVIACDLSASPETYGLGRCLSGLLFPVQRRPPACPTHFHPAALTLAPSSLSRM